MEKNKTAEGLQSTHGVPNWPNRTLFHGDNLDFLRAMNSNSVHLIATDPPFNKGRDFHATPDSLTSGASFHDRWSWDKDVHQEWVDQIMDDWPHVMHVIEGSRKSYGDDMGAFLCYMAVRLLEMHRILRDDGSLYLHCDTTASHYLKELLDAVFGWKNFKNQIIWRRTGSHNSADRFGPIHDVILFYAKPQYEHRVQFSPYLRGHVAEYFKKSDQRGRYWTNSIHGSGIRKGESGKPWRGYDPTAVGRHWAIPRDLVLAFGIDPSLPQHEKLDALHMLGLIDLPSVGSNSLPTYRQYLTDSPGQPIQDLWVYQPHTKGALQDTENEIDKDVRWIPKRDKKERTGYPTQKPLGLYGRIIQSSSNEGDIVLDPFAGCATTCVAAEKLSRQWVGIDFWDKVHEVIVERLEKEGLLGQFELGEINYTAETPERTDSGEHSSPFLKTKKRIDEPKGPKMSRKEMYEYLLEQHGSICQGCGREFDDARYLELDHNTPRSDRGLNHISNRILLCGPCNKAKSNTLTLSGLRKLNKKNGWMVSTEKLI